ncbi:CpsD/CapB family tyrosine-protein kinase [Methylomicrobium sp. RS1]|jgi:protein-tyrosine kinase|uniref:CpsD/CapB family tyrosine-protein kinase n=1 Tax=Candidatus Methylomicrobium oryzae TaxID=2802053 RepID=UPI0019249504|nr:CpsD/CapB family tyrosine-protein kinase [Methylomicrobium sp. RS1]MBL1264895.1 CpsD/CapB family tyrosine-protein kinase [Methylomicrobium sp. RS1]
MIKSADRQPAVSIRYPKIQTGIIDPEVLENNRVIMRADDDPRANIFRVLRTNVLRQLQQNSWNCFAVTSATPGAGKTFIAVNLAIAIAMEEDRNVLLVDADLKCPSIGKDLGLQFDFGLIDCLTSDLSLYDACINPGIERLVVLPGRNSDKQSSELISSRRMLNLIKEIKSRYASGIIIFDFPPLFAADDALLLLSHVDAALLVVEDGKTTTDELHHSMYTLEETNLLGLVLNKSRQPLPIYQYGYASETV